VEQRLTTSTNFLVALASYAVLVPLSYLRIEAPFGLPLLWIPYGAALLITLLEPRQRWILITISCFCLHVLVAAALDRPFYSVVVRAAVESFGVLAAARLISRDCEGRLHFGHVQDLARFSSGVLVSAALSGILVACLSPQDSMLQILLHGTHWCLAFALSAFLICPIPLYVVSWRESPPTWMKIVEVQALYVGLAIVTMTAFLPQYFSGAYLSQSQYAIVPFCIWSAMRFGPPALIVSVAVVASVGCLDLPGYTLWADATWAEVLSYQIFLASLLLVGLPLAVVVSERDRQNKMRMLEQRVFRLISSEAPLKQVLETIARGIEAQAPFMICSVLLFDAKQQRLLHGAAPSLPAEYNAFMHGLQVGPNAGSCGRAVFKRERVIVANTMNDPLWEAYRPLVKQFGLRACWSQPILSPLGEVLGTLALYYTEPRYPSNSEIRLIDEAVSLSALAISRERIERALRERERQYHALLASIAGVTFRADVVEGKRKLVSVSPSCQSVLGLAAEELIGRGQGFLDSEIHAEDSEKVCRLSCDVLRKQKILEIEYRIITRNGEQKWIWERSQAVYNVNGDLESIEGILLDATQRKTMEIEKSVIAEQLQQSQKMEAVGTLAGGIAHDFNNILGGMIGIGELIHARAADKNAVVDMIGQILKACHRARSMVRQILTFSRKTDDARRAVDLTNVIDDVLALLNASVPNTITVKKTIPKYLPRVFANETQMHQVLLNLAGNALHAMRGRSGVLEIQVSEVIVTGTLAALLPGLEMGQHLVLSVRDTGSGMDEGTVKRVFEPFFTTKSAGEGTGLGLSVVHGIVKNHKGAIHVESKVGVGTTFAVYLPCIGSQAEATENQEQEIPRGNGQRILFVDDEDALVFFGKEMLEELGYEVAAFSNSKEALAFFGRDPKQFDLILTDETMPGLSGIEFARSAAAMRRDIPIVASSGFYRAEGEQAYQGAGIRWFLDKPYNTESLATVVAKALGGEF
jgi:PAS domain S-box-containing protein